MKSLIDEYIERFPPHAQDQLTELRLIIRKVVPKAEEGISYGVAGFKLSGRYFIYFGGFTNHSSLYPFPSSNEEFKKLSTQYKTRKGTIQFQYGEPLPKGLITKIVRFRAKEALEKATKKA